MNLFRLDNCFKLIIVVKGKRFGRELILLYCYYCLVLYRDLMMYSSYWEFLLLSNKLEMIN